MSYRCPLQPPHVDSSGQPLIHKNRKECIGMGLMNRGVMTHPERNPDVARASVSSAPAGETPAAPVTTGEGATEPSLAPPSEGEKPKGKRKFSIFRKKAEASPEGETQHEAEENQPQWTLSGDLTVMFWTTVMSLGRGAISFIDKTIHAKKPYDTSMMEFTTSEEKMISETMPPLTTRILKWFGLKSEAAAETFIHGMVIVRIFGRIFLSVGAHFYDEMREKAKEKRALKNASKPPVVGQPPAKPETPQPEEQNGENPEQSA